MITNDFTRAIRSQLFGVEVVKDMGQLAISYDEDDEDEEIFPKAIEGPMRNYKDIYTPSNDHRETSRANKNLFITEAEEG